MGSFVASHRTTFTKFSKVHRHGDFAEVLVRLMMVCNDLTLIEDAGYRWQNETEGKRLHRQRGAQMYFNRVQMSHIYEAMAIIKGIQRRHMDRINAADPKTRESFAKIEAYLLSDDYKVISESMRNKITFHYDADVVVQTLDWLWETYGDVDTKWSDGDGSPLSKHFETGDRVAHSIVLRKFFKVPKAGTQADQDKAAGDIAERLAKVKQDFLDFAFYFIKSHVQRRALNWRF
jgi:hypothetical protein